MANKQGLALVVSLFLTYPARSVLVLGCLLLAGFAEGVGVATVVPLIGIMDSGGAAQDTKLGQMVVEALAWLGLRPKVEVLLTLIVVGFAAKAGLSILAMTQVGYAMAQISTDLRVTLIRALMLARWGYYTSQPVGSFANAVSIEAHRAGETYLNACRIIALAIQTAVYMGLALLVSWQVMLAGAVGGVVIVIVFGRLVWLARVAGNRQAAAYEALVRRLTDGLSGIKPLKAMAREDRLGPLLEAEARNLNMALRRQALLGVIMVYLQEPVVVVFLAVGLFAALTYGDAPFETLLVMALLFYRTVGLVRTAQRKYQSFAATEGYFQSLQDKIYRAHSAKEPSYGAAAPDFNTAVELSRVSFFYGEREVLHQVSMTIPAGKLTSIIGPSGAGKTTITDLIIGLHRPDSGKILVDGVSLSDIDITSWRREIGYVPQEMFLFHDTVLINVTLGDPNLSTEDAETALRVADAWDFVASLSEGLYTVVGERGLKISGGQRQRIALARALVRRPRLLILDEPTTALDPQAEKAICDTLRKLAGEVTILAISHQPALVEIADVVYRMADGKITCVEAGSYAARTVTEAPLADISRAQRGSS